MKNNELLPCPFCGMNPKIKQVHENVRMIYCDNKYCYAKPSICPPPNNDSNCIWNNRHTTNLVALDGLQFPIMEIQRICGVGLNTALKVKELIITKFGIPNCLTASDEKKIETMIRFGIFYKEECAGVTGVKITLVGFENVAKAIVAKFANPTPDAGRKEE